MSAKADSTMNESRLLKAKLEHVLHFPFAAHGQIIFMQIYLELNVHKIRTKGIICYETISKH